MEKEKLVNFDDFAGDYKKTLDESLKLGGETGEYFSHYKASYVRRHVGKGFSGRVLDYGCGIGLLSEVLFEHLPEAVIDGFDISAASIERIPAPLKEKGRFTSSMEHLNGGYDLIVVANVLHHIEPPQRESIIHQLRGLLNKNGSVVIFEHNPFNPLTRKVVRESPLDKGVVLLPSAETVTYLKKTGLRPQLDYIVFFPKAFAALRGVEPSLSWLPLGAQYAAIGKV